LNKIQDANTILEQWSKIDMKLCGVIADNLNGCGNDFQTAHPRIVTDCHTANSDIAFA
jgi:hypothetical protein